MYLFFSRLIPPFFFPPGLQIVFLIAGLVLLRRRPRLGYGLLVFSVATLYLLSTGFVCQFLLGWMEGLYPETPVALAPKADAIVVLGDFAQPPNQERPRFSLVQETDRLRTGALLFQAGKAPLIVTTGGSVGVSGIALTSQITVAKSLLREMGIPEAQILTEGMSQNTHENATFSKPLLLARHVHRILLVTSAFHLLRASAIFRKEGFEVVPFPADFRTGWANPGFALSLIPEARTLYYNQLAIHEFLGLAVYRLHGWI